MRQIPPPGQRITVVGTTGSGKTTLAERLAQILGLVHVELDALHWEPNWTPAPLEVFQERTALALSGDSWVVDGNYSKVRGIIWSRADTLVWLDYTLLLIMWRLSLRTFRRIVNRQELWNDNREDLRTSLFSRDSILLWALQTYRKRKRTYPKLFAQPEYSHLRVIHLRTPRETNHWLSQIQLRRQK